MKRLLVSLGVSFALVAIPVVALGQDLSSSPHDFTTGNVGNAPYNTAAGMCVSCHMPHSDYDGAQAPLWGHDTTNTAAGQFTMYSSATMDATVPAGPQGVSQACLSCHDGTIAVNAYPGNTAAAVSITAGDALLGQDLSNDHPISIEYDAGGAEFFNRPTANWAGTATDSLPLYANQVECGSCHNPHDHTTFTANTVSGSAFLRDNATDICVTCHNKG
jgi:predicted CXXCH cytochrome family protein